MDCSLPGSSVHGICQARILEWVAISFSNAGKWKVKVKSLVISDSSQPHGLQPTRFLCPWDFSRQEYWSGVPLPSPWIKLDTHKISLLAKHQIMLPKLPFDYKISSSKKLNEKCSRKKNYRNYILRMWLRMRVVFQRQWPIRILHFSSTFCFTNNVFCQQVLLEY